jgi:hypothetical protein
MPNDLETRRPSALVARTRLGDAEQMDHDHTFVMLDPTTDQVLAECDGPDVRGRCPMADRPPYICAGLHLIGIGDGSGHGEFTVTKMEPGRCPIAAVNQPRAILQTEYSRPNQ